MSRSAGGDDGKLLAGIVIEAVELGLSCDPNEMRDAHLERASLRYNSSSDEYQVLSWIYYSFFDNQRILEALLKDIKGPFSKTISDRNTGQWPRVVWAVQHITPSNTVFIYSLCLVCMLLGYKDLDSNLFLQYAESFMRINRELASGILAYFFPPFEAPPPPEPIPSFQERPFLEEFAAKLAEISGVDLESTLDSFYQTTAPSTEVSSTRRAGITWRDDETEPPVPTQRRGSILRIRGKTPGLQLDPSFLPTSYSLIRTLIAPKYTPEFCMAILESLHVTRAPVHTILSWANNDPRQQREQMRERNHARHQGAVKPTAPNAARPIERPRPPSEQRVTITARPAPASTHQRPQLTPVKPTERKPIETHAPTCAAIPQRPAPEEESTKTFVARPMPAFKPVEMRKTRAVLIREAALHADALRKAGEEASEVALQLRTDAEVRKEEERAKMEQASAARMRLAMQREEQRGAADLAKLAEASRAAKKAQEARQQRVLQEQQMALVREEIAGQESLARMVNEAVNAELDARLQRAREQDRQARVADANAMRTQTQQNEQEIEARNKELVESAAEHATQQRAELTAARITLDRTKPREVDVETEMRLASLAKQRDMERAARHAIITEEKAADEQRLQRLQTTVDSILEARTRERADATRRQQEMAEAARAAEAAQMAAYRQRLGEDIEAKKRERMAQAARERAQAEAEQRRVTREIEERRKSMELMHKRVEESLNARAQKLDEEETARRNSRRALADAEHQRRVALAQARTQRPPPEKRPETPPEDTTIREEAEKRRATQAERRIEKMIGTLGIGILS